MANVLNVRLLLKFILFYVYNKNISIYILFTFNNKIEKELFNTCDMILYRSSKFGVKRHNFFNFLKCSILIRIN